VAQRCRSAITPWRALALNACSLTLPWPSDPFD
jgi:hypothetical protein